MDLNSTVEVLSSKETTSLTTIITVISFFITIQVALSLYNMRKFFKFKVRGPQIIDDLHTLASELSNHLNDFSGMNAAIRQTLADVDVKLNSLNKIIDNHNKRKSKELQKLIQDIEPKSTSYRTEVYEERLNKIHIGLYKLRKQVMEQSEDSKWEQA